MLDLGTRRYTTPSTTGWTSIVFDWYLKHFFFLLFFLYFWFSIFNFIVNRRFLKRCPFVFEICTARRVNTSFLRTTREK